MDASRPHVAIRPARADDLPLVEGMRQAAFAPVFTAFRALLGDVLYALVQAREEEAQQELLVSLLAAASGWEVSVAEVAGTGVGFVALQLNHETHVGEIGFNAVHPQAWGPED